MAETFFSAANYPLSLLIENIEAGEIALPGIQRPFVWPNAKVRDLFDSLYRGFPVGYLLFAPYDAWKTGTTGKSPRLLIVDGQQRLTSLYSVIKGTPVMRDDFREERIRLAFRPRDGRFEIADAAVRNDPEFIQDVGPLLSGQVSQYGFVREFLERLRAQRPVDYEEETRISSAIYRLYDLPSYSFTVLQLSRSLDEEQVAEVFVRINSRGVPLSRADFILTLMAVSWDEGRRDLEQFCRHTRTAAESGEVSPFNALIRPTPDQMIRVVAGLAFRRVRLQAIYSILRGTDPETGQVSEERRTERFKALEDSQRFALDPRNWQDFLGAVVAAGFLSKDMIPSETALLGCYTLFLIGRKDFGVDERVLRGLMARWIFATVLTGRYTGSAENAIEADLARLRTVENEAGFVAALEEAMAGALTERFWSADLPVLLTTTSPHSTGLLSYYAAMNTLGAIGLFSEARVSQHFEGKAALARRQLFSRRYLAKLGRVAEDEASQVANYVLAAPGIAMSGSPREYFPKLALAFGPERLAETERWHALPKGWQKMSYASFLEARRKAIAAVIREAARRLAETPLPEQSRLVTATI